VSDGRRNYVQVVRDELVERLPNLDAALIDLYTLLALQYGQQVDAVMVHNAWSVWCNRTQPDHRSLIPFPFLAPEVQELDEPYVDAIRQAVDAVEREYVQVAGQAGGDD
jgi:hypothetical protein